MRNRGYLVDTHIFLWLMEKSKRIAPKIYTLLSNPQIKAYISVASIWEIILKRNKTPLKVPRDIIKSIKRINFSILPIEAVHVMEVEKLPNVHTDPFDRILIAQAREEKLIILTSDPKFKKYKVKLFS